MNRYGCFINFVSSSLGGATQQIVGREWRERELQG
jgi:hypothetical protein